MVDVGKDYLVSKKDQGGMNRRDFLKKAGMVGVGAVATAAGLGVLARRKSEGPSKEQDIKGLYVVKEHDTFGVIARGAFPNYNENQDWYNNVILTGSGFDPNKTPTLYPGEKLYIPDLGTPTYGLALGGEKMGIKFEGMKAVGDEKMFQISIGGQTLPGEGLKIGQEFVAPSENGSLVRYRLTNHLSGMPTYNVPDRMVFEQVKPPSK